MTIQQPKPELLPLWKSASSTPKGSTFDPALDRERLGRQHQAVLAFVLNTGWHTLEGIAAAVRSPEASVSARLRDFRRDGFTVERRRVPDGNGLHEYRVSRCGSHLRTEEEE